MYQFIYIFNFTLNVLFKIDLIINDNNINYNENK